MAKKKDKSKFLSKITRRDFIAGSLVGAGSALLYANAPLSFFKSSAKQKSRGVFNDPWTGFGGVGDYGISNGNVASTRDAAHLIRDENMEELFKTAKETGEEYDMIIIGGGFSSIGAAYEFNKAYGDTKKCLILENHPVFGGEAKQNEFDVDGYRIFAPQGSNDFGLPNEGDDNLIAEIYRKTGLPFEFKFVNKDPNKSKVDTPLDNYYGVFWEEERYDTGYFMGKDAVTPWVINPREDRLARMPWSNEFKAELNRAFDDKETYYKGDDIDTWLDSMTYKELLEKEMGFSSKVTEYFDPIVAISMGAVGCDVLSAYSARQLEMPGTEARYEYDSSKDDYDVGVYSFPGGNTGIYRHIIKYLIPEAITGDKEFEAILYNDINFEALDRPENAMNIRLNSTAIAVQHEGKVEASEYVNVTYYQDGKVKKVKAKSVVMGIGGWVAQKIIPDLPEPLVKAYDEFYHGPILTVNIAVRNWRFLDKLGISSGRIFEGFGNFFSIRRPMITGKDTQPYDPEKPIVLTFYVPFNKPGYSIKEQGALGRLELLNKSYAEYEQEIVEQMTAMFAAAGFDAERDIAGIILNRWGHAYISPQPGFHFGKDGNEAPKDIVRKGFGRIQFGHSELSGYMSHTRALNEGSRAAIDAMRFI
jgi:spermidine dehydrogenase